MSRTVGPHVGSGRPSRRPAGRSRGQAIVETALLLPLVMLLVMGSSDLGRVFYYSIETTNAVREGARQGIYFDPRTQSNVNNNDAAILSAVKAEAPDLSLTEGPNHCLTGSPSSWGPYYPTASNTGYVFICYDGNPAESAPASSTIGVTILYNFQPVTPLVQVVGSATVQVLSSVTMQVQQKP